ncbi:DDE-type integrase/transposase/recombinase [Ferrovibrio sp.]|uniref:Mu transposase C-terminal domain-containing protein n=1 Tax=Ferrovibrio sp. TaxID=1917215 RepID=UPI003513265D
MQKLKRDIAGLSAEERKLFERKWAYIRPLHLAGMTQLSEAMAMPMIAATAKALNDPAAPSYSTIRRWFRDFLAAGRDIRSLFPSTRHRGWRGRRLPRQVLDIVARVVRDRYLTPERATVRRVYDAVLVAIDAENSRPGRKSVLPVPSLRWLYDEINRHTNPYERIAKRYGRVAADLKFRAWNKGITTTRPLERIEVDHTKLDLIVMDSQRRFAIGRPWLTIAIDAYTRMPVGFHIGFVPPSWHSVLSCLKHAIHPKTAALARYDDIANDWPCYGIPECIVVDNGKEFHSRSFEMACQQLDIQILHARVRSPWLKPIVERFFGIINSQLLAGLPGRTFSNVIERGEYKSEKNAAISLQVLVRILYTWIVGDFSQDIRRGIHDIPVRRWNEGIEKYPARLPAAANDVEFALSHIADRTIQHYGVQLLGLIYQSEELAAIRLANRGAVTVTVRYDVSDLGSINVIDPGTGIAISVPAIDQEYARGLSLQQHRVFRKYRREATDPQIRQLSLAKVRERIVGWYKNGWEEGTLTSSHMKAARLLGVDGTNPAGRPESGADGVSSEGLDAIGRIAALEGADLDDDDDLIDFDEEDRSQSETPHDADDEDDI